MSQQTLQDLLGQIQSDHKEAFDNAREGKAPNGDWNVDLPLNLEYRVRVDKAEYKNSQSSGKPQIVLTYEVVEPAEYQGAKFQDYQSPTPTTTVGAEVLAKTFGALQAKLDGWGNDFSAFVAQFEDRTAVVALRRWGQNDDRIGVRYINLDKGQTLSTKVNPPRPKRDTNALRPEINIPKEETASGGDTPAPAPAPAPNLPTGGGGPNLPPGLRS